MYVYIEKDGAQMRRPIILGSGLKEVDDEGDIKNTSSSDLASLHY